MIAIPLTGQQRERVVASPSYLATHSAPAHPRELVAHRCIGWRPSPDVAPIAGSLRKQASLSMWQLNHK